MKTKELKDNVMKILLESGWSEARDKSKKLVIDSKKFVSKSFNDTARNLAYLKLSFKGYSG